MPSTYHSGVLRTVYGIGYTNFSTHHHSEATHPRDALDALGPQNTTEPWSSCRCFWSSSLEVSCKEEVGEGSCGGFKNKKLVILYLDARWSDDVPSGNYTKSYWQWPYLKGLNMVEHGWTGFEPFSNEGKINGAMFTGNGDICNIFQWFQCIKQDQNLPERSPGHWAI